MRLPIIPYGSSILRTKCKDVKRDSSELQELIDSMWKTMYSAYGQGLAAPQVDSDLKLFIVDNLEVYQQLNENHRQELFDGDQGIKETFINAKILSRSEKSWIDYEGCLSIPSLSEQVKRPWSIEIEYLDRNFRQHKRVFHGMTARVIQHEFDHTEGIVYIDHISPLRKKLLARKLKKIATGQVSTDYTMKRLSGVSH